MIKRINDTVYKADLLSVREDIRVNRDYSKKDNINEAEVVPVKTILVKPSWNPNYMVEIITGLKIPVFRIQCILGGDVYHGVLMDRLAPKKPYFIQYTEEFYNEEYRSNSLKEASLEEVKEYIREEDKDALREELMHIFAEAERYYLEAYQKEVLSDKSQIKRLIRSIKK